MFRPQSLKGLHFSGFLQEKQTYNPLPSGIRSLTGLLLTVNLMVRQNAGWTDQVFLILECAGIPRLIHQVPEFGQCESSCQRWSPFLTGPDRFLDCGTDSQ